MNNTNEEEKANDAVGGEGYNIQAAYAALRAAREDCDIARVCWSENGYASSKKWIELAVLNLQNALGRITLHQAQNPSQDDAEKKCDFYTGHLGGYPKCGLPVTHKLEGGGLFYCPEHAEIMGIHVEKI